MDRFFGDSMAPFQYAQISGNNAYGSGGHVNLSVQYGEITNNILGSISIDSAISVNITGNSVHPPNLFIIYNYLSLGLGQGRAGVTTYPLFSLSDFL